MSSGNAKILTSKEAIEFFNKIQQNPLYACNYPTDGCYARAHLMGKEATQMGLEPKKIWNRVPADFDDRKINISYGTKHRITGKKERKYQNFNYHVAIIMPVKDLHGTVKDLVFDPVLFDGPADPRQWAEELHAADDENTICALDKKPYPNYSYYNGSLDAPNNPDVFSKKRLLKYSLLSANKVVERTKSAWLMVDKVKEEQAKRQASKLVSYHQQNTR